jgi:catechol 2,3-dioxygenase-like lactoylglutathione lyase family enzyme
MGHLHFLTTQPEAHLKLFVDVLGGQHKKSGPLDWAVFPGVFLAFRKGEPAGGTDGSVVHHIGFLVKDIDATKAKLVAAGVTIERDMPQTRQFFAMFPDNVRIEFTEDKTIDVPIQNHHIHFASHQVEEMRAWYVKTFAAVPGMRKQFKAADIPGVNLSWNAAETAPLPSKGRSLDHIGFELTDIKAFCAKLEADGIKLDSPVRTLPDLGLTIAFLTDPWGTRIELTEGLAAVK